MIIDLFVHVYLIHLTSIKCRPIRFKSHNTIHITIFTESTIRIFAHIFNSFNNHNPYVCIEIIGVEKAPTPTFVSLGFLLSMFEPFTVD